MELWIRSQNKHTLIKCNYITTLEKDIYGNTEYTIINEDELELGRYDSEKRLLEVLDEIQDILEKNQPSIISYSNGDIVNINGNYVYEMPEN